MQQIHLGAIDYVILVVYLLFVLGIGWVLRRSVKDSEDFFLSGRSIPAPTLAPTSSTACSRTA